MAAARQNEMNDNITVVATTTLVVVVEREGVESVKREITPCLWAADGADSVTQVNMHGRVKLA